MKIIKIGRDETSNIMLDHEMVSRHHAILKIHPSGKMELISMGVNGTKLNGVQMRPNVVYEVKRSDMVSFAGKHQLDWSLIPNPRKTYFIVAIAIAIVILLIASIVAGTKVYNYFNPEVEDIYMPSPFPGPQPKPEPAPGDSGVGIIGEGTESKEKEIKEPTAEEIWDKVHKEMKRKEAKEKEEQLKNKKEKEKQKDIKKEEDKKQNDKKEKNDSLPSSKVRFV